ncbi:hypothetical protein EYF80_048158 [Liparis tanakae]|uniref:Uncharacterized protein n=1 Tax=Liparis tanakae TaxID=230148 RepID=A0A4Z2FL87_9TELE|nr:hypothetical protein EYF80_048158 [Liparis tanakae]
MATRKGALTLEGIRVAGDEVLQLEAVGLDVVERFSFHSQLAVETHYAYHQKWKPGRISEI